MKTFYADEQKRHNPKGFLSSGVPQPNPEKPERAERLVAGVVVAGCSIHRPKDYGLGPIAAVHTPEYLEFLQNIYRRWQLIPGASQEVVPNIHPISRTGSYPASAVGQAGYHMADTACPISAETWESACWSAFSAVEAAEAVMSGESAAYALCRPPGHHAFVDVAGGFCFINNSAVAAQRLRKNAARVAILDVDLHHGNGTQGIFYARPDVLTVSIHADPVRFYPFFWGYAEERGEGAGSATIITCRSSASPAMRSFSKRSKPPANVSRPSRPKRWSWHLALMRLRVIPSVVFLSLPGASLASLRRSRNSACRQ